jgi:hypothetical protein
MKLSRIATRTALGALAAAALCATGLTGASARMDVRAGG